MKIDNVRFGFATNSSSSHSLVFLKRPVDDDYVDGRFGWGYFTAASKKAKDQYAAITLAEAFKESGLPQHIVNDLIAKWSSVDPEKFVTDEDMNNYIDHQSVMVIPCEFGTQVPDKQFFAGLQEFLRQPALAILGGNDNDNERHPLGSGRFGLNVPQDRRASHFVCRYDAQYKFWTIFNRQDGTKIRMRFLNDRPNDFRPTKASAPELVDIKITDRCGFGCPFCYQGSTPGGKDANTSDIATLAEALGQLKVFEVAIGGGEPTEHPDFLEILQRFKRHGVTPNFTTKSMAWMRDPARFSPILANCGAFAYSISGRQDLEKFNMLRLDSGLEHGTDGSDPKATVQLVMGTVEEDAFCQILEYCAAQHLPITLLGFKEVGRGATFKKLPYPWLIKRLSAMENRYLVGVDTAIIAEFEQELVALGVPSVLYTKEEGKFSCYIDAVSGRIGPSSYCAESAYKPLDLKAYPASKIADSIACSFGTF